MYLSEYINYLHKWHGYTITEAELLIEDVKPTIYWYESIGEDVYKYLSNCVTDTFQYSEITRNQ